MSPRDADWLLVALVVLGTLPPLVGIFQFALATVHRLRLHRPDPSPDGPPRVAIVVPAWNEALVIERTLDRLTALDYPDGRLRVYVVDDASTDATPQLVRAKAEQHPGTVVHLRREQGGEGKAHTINHGLRRIAADGWAQAVMIIDADVILTPDCLSRLTAHLADPQVGAVTAYIKEGSAPGNFLNRFVSFEYITAQAGARRAQNVLGAQACLAGGAQLIAADVLAAIGGQIDTTTLAEDTVTTFHIQQTAGKRVVFDPHAIVWAEEPRGLGALWKQRLRWGRGNVQVTRKFNDVWFKPWRRDRLGGVSFGLIWFTVTLMPLFMLAASVGLIGLFCVDRSRAAGAFGVLYALNIVSYAFVTLSSFSMDPATARRVWREGLCFPGLISVAIIVYTIAPGLFTHVAPHGVARSAIVLAVYAWTSASMLAAYLVKRLQDAGRAAWLVAPLLYLVGYGPLLCAMTAAAYLKELRGAEMTWEKTEKTGHVGEFA